jgi:hypothetical protein
MEAVGMPSNRREMTKRDIGSQRLGNCRLSGPPARCKVIGFKTLKGRSLHSPE